MTRQFATRSQRRLEKKQAVILLALVLVVSLVSFALGVMVGRSSVKPVVAVAPQAVRLPVAEAVPPPTAVAPAAGERPADSLTFYDSLPKGGQAPLGSGINLPPAKVPTPEEATAQPSPIEPANLPAAATAIVVQDAAPVKPDVPAPPPARAPASMAKAGAPATKAAAPAAKVAAPAAGGYLVQAAAFRRSEDAKRLQSKLARKGYSVFTEEANLGAKGVWYRVYVGPYASAGAADAVVTRLKAEEKLAGLVRKR